MRLVSTVVFLSVVGVCAPAVAQDRPESVEPAATAAATEQVEASDSAASILLAALRPSAFKRPEKAIVLRKATKSVVHAVKSGLVLMDVDLKKGDSRIYVKFWSDGMPRLRWQTRFY